MHAAQLLNTRLMESSCSRSILILLQDKDCHDGPLGLIRSQ